MEGTRAIWSSDGIARALSGDSRRKMARFPRCLRCRDTMLRVRGRGHGIPHEIRGGKVGVRSGEGVEGEV